MIRKAAWAVFLAAGLFVPAAASEESARHEVLVVVGAAGEEQFADGFRDAARAWVKASRKGGARCDVLGLEPEEGLDDRDRMQAWLAALDPASPAPAWVVFIGHGTWDGRQARMNLRGPDVTPEELAQWIAPLARPFILIHGGSSSAPFIPALSGPGRIIITATSSGDEVNYARFGERFAEAIGDPESDINQDGEVSLLEAFLRAAREVQLFYAESGRLATEHALIDDNGDRLGTPAEWFRGTRLIQRPEGDAEPDGARAHQISLIRAPGARELTADEMRLRDRLEAELEELRRQKASLDESDYLLRLEAILRQLIPVYLD